MARRIDRLKHETREAAAGRGHDLTRFKREEEQGQWLSVCRQCGGAVLVSAGECVALDYDCPSDHAEHPS